MYEFVIEGGVSSHEIPGLGGSAEGVFLRTSVHAYYHDDYHPRDGVLREHCGTVEYVINKLKNQFGSVSRTIAGEAKQLLFDILVDDLPRILKCSGKKSLVLCVVPRAKRESQYVSTQLLFKEAVRDYAIRSCGAFEDGTDYISREVNTRTTHMNRSGYGGDGDMPYPGITNQTCKISDKVLDKDILLIDDLYTEGINIDEDALQAILDAGARSVLFYALGKTTR